jgi:Icc-related predicted phosphoesterase
LAGLGGCKSGREDACEYTERTMSRKVRALSRLIRRQGGLDILLTHVSALGLGDGEDLYHQGFTCFRELLDAFKPRYHVFGHQHKEYGRRRGPERYGETRLINACGYKVIEY